MKKIITIIAIITSILFVSCLTPQQIDRFQKKYCSLTDSTSTVITNTIYKEPVWYMDSTYIKLWFDCNENNEVYIKKSETYQGKYTEVQSKLDSLSILHIKTKTIIHDTIYIEVHDTSFYQQKTRIIYTNELTKSQNFWIRTGKWSFSITLILIVIALIYTFFRFKSKIIGFFKGKIVG